MVRLRWWRVSWTNPIMKHNFSFQWQEKNLASIGKSSSQECFEAELSFNLPLSWAELSKEVKVLFLIFNLAISGDKPAFGIISLYEIILSLLEAFSLTLPSYLINLENWLQLLPSLDFLLHVIIFVQKDVIFSFHFYWNIFKLFFILLPVLNAFVSTVESCTDFKLVFWKLLKLL